MTRERCGQTRGAGSVGARAVLVLAPLAAALGSCLVTQEATYEALDSQSVIIVNRPADHIFRVPFAPDVDSNCSDGISFDVTVKDRDVEQPLSWLLYLNDGFVVAGNLEAAEGDREVRVFAQQRPCLSKQAIQNSLRRCNRVTLAVTPDPVNLFTQQQLVQLRAQPDYSSALVDWYVLKSSQTDPQVSASECAPPPPMLPDAGVAP